MSQYAGRDVGPWTVLRGDCPGCVPSWYLRQWVARCDSEPAAASAWWDDEAREWRWSVVGDASWTRAESAAAAKAAADAQLRGMGHRLQSNPEEQLETRWELNQAQLGQSSTSTPAAALERLSTAADPPTRAWLGEKHDVVLSFLSAFWLRHGGEDLLPAEERSPAKRTAANLAAMRLAAGKKPEEMTEADRVVLSGYSGWGGLSIAGVADQFPPGFPAPAERGLIHEYYTPARVCAEVARVVKPLLSSLQDEHGQVLALEPSAGIGRFVRAFEGPGFEYVTWVAVEWSEASARMLGALRSDIVLYVGPFEQWVQRYEADYRGKFGLVVSNPPYGTRGAAITEDSNRDYRERKAYVYFLRRGLDLLAPGGVGVYLVPYGFLTGRSQELVTLRERVLKRHHLMMAFRLPSGLFPGAMLVTDLLFFRARGGTLYGLDDADRFIVEGQYFKRFPAHVLGAELGTAGDDDDQTAKPRWGYQVSGEFIRLPDVAPRPQVEGAMTPDTAVIAGRRRRVQSIGRQVVSISGLPEHLDSAVALGLRVDTYLAALARQDAVVVGLYGELSAALTAWLSRYGNPRQSTELVALARDGVTGAERFLSAVDAMGALLPGLASPPVVSLVASCAPSDLAGHADVHYRSQRRCTVDELLRFHQSQGGPVVSPFEAVSIMVSAGWAVDGENWNELLPMKDYLTGSLWPRYDRAVARAQAGDAQADRQAGLLLDAIKPVLFADMKNYSPRQGWIPTEMLALWMSETMNNHRPVSLVKLDGLYQLEDQSYETIRDARYMPAGVVNCIGWLNHDKSVFRPRHSREETLDEVRVKAAAHWERSFVEWVSATQERQQKLEHIYNRQFRGYVEETFSGEPLSIARWSPAGRKPHPWQAAGARRLVKNRGGLLAFDTGVGKTLSGIAALAIARQEGWAKRPVLLVPNTVVYNWRGEILNVLPDYRICIIGQKKVERKPQAIEGKVRLARPDALAVWQRAKPCDRRGQQVLGVLSTDYMPADQLGVPGVTSGLLEGLRDAGYIEIDLPGVISAVAMDTPAERAEKWTRFQAGEYDVVILPYSMLDRTRMNLDALKEYAASVESIQRSIRMTLRNLRKEKDKAEEREDEEYEENPGLTLDELEDADYFHVGWQDNPRKTGEEKHRERTERQAAYERESTAAWLAEKMELDPGEEYDVGIAWDDLGVDFLLVDEAQNFKNLYLPEAREGGVPKWMGSPGAESKRAWHLDFRCAAVRRRTGGTGVVLLSATPAKNSPLEYYNIIQYVDPTAWTRLGIMNPEQFIDRYLKIRPMWMITVRLTMEQKPACVGFKNLFELYDVVTRYAEFKDAKTVGLKIPEAVRNNVFVDMDAIQREKYDDYVTKINAALEAMKHRAAGAKGEVFKALAGMSLVAVHGNLDEKYTWETAARAVDAGRVVAASPKFAAVAERIRANATCAHLCFFENLAGHVWLRRALIDAGIPEERIAVMNGRATKTPMEREMMALALNGNMEEKVAPVYDVLIANSVAYEGINLQTRTCEIHHVDQPWEPATLHQRDGRGVRQKNTLAAVTINHYFTKGSSDGTRFAMIEGKRGWMDAFLSRESDEMDNPAAVGDVGMNEIMALIARDPEDAQRRLAQAKAEAVAREREHTVQVIVGKVRSAAARFAKARSTFHPAEAARLREDAEGMLADILQTDPAIWPWVGHAARMRDQDVAVSADGHRFIFEGMRVATDLASFEVGRIGPIYTGTRAVNRGEWSRATIDSLPWFQPEHGDSTDWPAGDEAESMYAAREAVRDLQWSNAVLPENWHLASDRWRDVAWREIGPEVIAVLSKAKYGRTRRIPVTVDGHLVLLEIGRLAVTPSARVIPFTEDGWKYYMSVFVESSPKQITHGDAARVGNAWWDRDLPRGMRLEAVQKEILQ